jgi:taurine dioxygenase
MPFTVNKLSYALGAEVRGLDLRQRHSDETIAEIRQAWLDNLVLCFRDQDLTPREQMAFCSRFGTLDDHRTRPLWNLPDLPEVLVVANKPLEFGGKKLLPLIADKWHTDNSFSVRSATASWLHARQLPPMGGDTMFANMYQAYDALSPSMKDLAATLQGVHDVSFAPDWHRFAPEVQAERRRLSPPVVHSLVRVHPETGRKVIFAGGFVRHFVGFTELESKPLLDFFNTHATAYEFVYRHKWALGDMLMWDNRCLMHYAVQDYDRTQLRRMQRCSLYAPESGVYFRPDAQQQPVAAMS